MPSSASCSAAAKPSVELPTKTVKSKGKKKASKRSLKVEGDSVVHSEAPSKKVRKRCREKCKAEPSTADILQIEGYTVEQHPLCLAYGKLPNAQRRLVSKRVSQSKYRYYAELRSNWEVKLGDECFSVTNEKELESEIHRFDHAFFLRLARDTSKCKHDRGYAMTQLKDAARSLFMDLSGANARIFGVPSALLTYNGASGLLSEESIARLAEPSAASSSSAAASPPVVTKSMDPDSLARRLKHHPKVLELEKRLETTGRHVTNMLKTPHYAWSIEVCTRTLRAEGRVRIHCHLWLSLAGHSLTLSDASLGNDMLPFANFKVLNFLGVAKSRGSAQHMAGNFYCVAEKIGSISRFTTVEPWLDYAVRDIWVTSLFSGGKLSAATARECYLKCVGRAQCNVQQIDFVEQERLQLQRQRTALENERRLRSTLKPWKPQPEVDIWRAQFQDFRGRYKFVVFDGPSSTGKTRYAMQVVDVGACLYSDCTQGIPNLRAFDPMQHKAILLDELSPERAIELKKLLQSSNEVVTLGASPTMSHAYELHVHGCMIMICTNEWAVGLARLRGCDRDWLVHNSIYVHVSGPMWVD